jgi:hypothetical protein
MGMDWDDDWAMEEAAQHGHADLGMGEDDPESEERLESERNMRRSGTNYNRRDESEADRREMRNSVTEDNINANRVHGGKGGRWAGGMDGLRELIHRVGVDSGSRPAHAKETGPNNFDGGGVEDRLRFVKKLDRLVAK